MSAPESNEYAQFEAYMRQYFPRAVVDGAPLPQSEFAVRGGRQRGQGVRGLHAPAFPDCGELVRHATGYGGLP